jgi:hypothetical protein
MALWPLVERTRAGLGDFGGGAVAEQACIGGERSDRGAAEQPPRRQVRRFAGDIPKRDIQGGQRVNVWAVTPEQARTLGEARHQAANVARVLAERGRSELCIDDSARRRAAGVTETFAQPSSPWSVTTRTSSVSTLDQPTSTKAVGVAPMSHGTRIGWVSIETIFIAASTIPCAKDVVTKIGALKLLRQVGFQRRSGQHDAAARQGIDSIGKRKRFLD